MRAKSRNEELATAIFETLHKKKTIFRRDCGKKKAIAEMMKVLSTFASSIAYTDLNEEAVQRYNKGDLRKDLIKGIKGGKIEAAKLLADLDGMKNNTDDVVVITMNFEDVPTAPNGDALYEEYKTNI